jgi:hypothetical protein
MLLSTFIIGKYYRSSQTTVGLFSILFPDMPIFEIIIPKLGIPFGIRQIQKSQL